MGKRKGNQSLQSVQRSGRQTKVTKEQAISERIQELYKKREADMVKIIKQTIFDDKLKYYKHYRKEYENKLQDLEREKVKIMRRKKNKQLKQKALRKNTIEKLQIVCKIIKSTFIHYKKQYFESDHYRLLKLIQIQEEDMIMRQQKTTDKQHSEKEPATEKKSVKKVKKSKDDQSPDKMGEDDDILDENVERPEKAQTVPTSGLTSMRTGIQPIYRNKKCLHQLLKYFESPFKSDKLYGAKYMVFLTRDKMVHCEDAVNQLFYDKIFNMLLQSVKLDDEIGVQIRRESFDMMSNMVASNQQRHKLGDEEYFSRIFEKMSYVTDSNPKSESQYKEDMRILEKLSWMITLISYHHDMYKHIVNLNLLQFILKISDQKYPDNIRSNAVLAISMLTYNENLFEEIIKEGVIDVIMALCRDPNQETTVKQFSWLALVHFALNRRSINILIEKNVLELFETFGAGQTDNEDSSEENNIIIQTNVSWIFLALCNNGITGKAMLDKGITRDMFLVSCNPDYQQIRDLVITAFAELGRCKTNLEMEKESLPQERQRIKEQAIIGMDFHTKKDPQANIDIILAYSTCKNLDYQYTAYWALKDYILLTHDALIPDITNIINALIIGSLSSEQKIQEECADAISFLVTHRLVYKSHYDGQLRGLDLKAELQRIKILRDIEKAPVEYILDSIMYLSGSDSDFIRTRAFSTLGSLSKYSSECKSVKQQIYRDIKIPSNLTSKDYLDFVTERLTEQKKVFEQKMADSEKASKFPGLYALLRLSQEPNDEQIEDASNKFIEFIESPYDPEDADIIRNENYFLKVWAALKHSKKPKILQKLLRVIRFYIYQDDSNCQNQIINPPTILWMLEIMEHQKNQKYLCCLTSNTLLDIVSKLEIRFEHQEVAIIKKFNQALQNIDVFDSEEHEDEIDAFIAQSPTPISPQEPGKEHEKTIVTNFTRSRRDSQILIPETYESKLVTSVDPRLSKNSDGFLNQDIPQTTGNGDNTSAVAIQFVEVEDKDLSRRGSESINSSTQKEDLIKMDHNELDMVNLNEEELQLDKKQQTQQPSKLPTIESVTNEIEHDDEIQIVQISSYDKIKNEKPQGKLQKVNENSLDGHSRSSSKNSKLSEQRRGGISKSKIYQQKLSINMSRVEKNSLENRSNQCESPDILAKVKQQAVSITSSRRNMKLFGSKQSAQVAISQDTLHTKNGQKLSQFNDEVKESKQTLKIDDIDPNDEEQVDGHLRDSLIKAFMVIFTNEHSQHLLLNKDLIDIAFNCLEFCNECTLEAKKHVSRLISIIFKFPQVQKKLMTSEVVIGICDLLGQKEQEDIIRYTIKACSYISMNYNFIKKQELSLQILKSMMALLDHMEKRDDRYNIIMTIKNILKGDKENKKYFLDNGGTKKFTDIILNSNDLQLIEICIQGIAEQASFKKFMVEILSQPEATEHLKEIILKCLNQTQDWLKEKNEHNNKVVYTTDHMQINEGPNNENEEIQSKNIDFQQDSLGFDYSVNESHIEIPEFMKNDLQAVAPQNDEGLQYEQQFKLTRQGKIRNSIYYVIARAIKFGIDTQYLLEDCNLIQRIIDDLGYQNENHFMFQNLLLIIQNLKLEQATIVDFVGNNYQKIIKQLYETNDQDRRVSLLKVLLNLILEGSENLSLNQMLFTEIFDICRDPRSDDSMNENILWLATSLCEQSTINKNYKYIRKYLKENDIIGIICTQLRSSCERNILQALKLLTYLAADEKFRPKLFENPQCFKNLQYIAERGDILKRYQIEIQTSLCKCLDKVTQADQSFGNLTTDALTSSSQELLLTQQLDQIKIFNKYLINLAFQKNYIIKRLDDENKEIDHVLSVSNENLAFKLFQERSRFNSGSSSPKIDKKQTQSGSSQVDNRFSQTHDNLEKEISLVHITDTARETRNIKENRPGKYTSKTETSMVLSSQEGTLNFRKDREPQYGQFDGKEELDDIERLENSNQMLENIICTLSNITGEEDLQHELVQNGILDCVRKFVNLFLACAQTLNSEGINELQEGIDLAIMPTGALQLLKAISVIILNLSTNQKIHSDCVDHGIYEILMNCHNLHDYEVKTNLFKAMGNFLIGKESHVRKQAIYNGCLQYMLEAQQLSPFVRVQRICLEYLNQLVEVDRGLFEMNDIVMSQKRMQQQMAEQIELQNEVNLRNEQIQVVSDLQLA